MLKEIYIREKKSDNRVLGGVNIFKVIMRFMI